MKIVISGLCVWLVIILLLFGCANGQNVSDKENSKIYIDSIDFLNVCNRLNSFIMYSDVEEEGLDRGPFVVANCDDSRKDSFSLIFKCKSIVGVDGLDKQFSKGKENNYKNFYVYAFIFTRVSKEEKDEGLQEVPDIYPSMVRVYKRVDESWVYLDDEQVNNMTAYSRFIRKTLKQSSH